MAVNAIDGTKKKLGQLKTSAETTNSALLTMGKGLLAGFGVGAAMNFMQSSIQAYREQEVAIKKLNTAYNGSTFGLERYAAELQKVTTFADEVTLDAMARISVFVKEESQIKALTKAAMDFATVKDIDLASAADLITKTFASETNALSRYGLVVEGAAGSTERFSSVIQALTKYQGQAEAQGKTLSGQIDIMNNQLNDQQEDIGAGLLPVWLELNKAFATGIKLLQLFSGYTGGRMLAEREKELKEIVVDRTDQMYELLGINNSIVIGTFEKVKAEKQITEENKKQVDYQHELNKYMKNVTTRGMEDSVVGVPLEMVTTYYDARAQLSLEFTNMEIANWLLMQDVSVGIFGDMAGAAMNFYDASGNAAKGWFGVYKAMAIAQTAIATYQAAVEAYKAMVGIPIVGPGLAVAAAAAATAFGVSNIARIAAMQPGGSFGGGGSASVPSIPANNITNNNQRSNNYVITINTQGAWTGDKDKFARELIYYIDKARGDGG